MIAVYDVAERATLLRAALRLLMLKGMLSKIPTFGDIARVVTDVVAWVIMRVTVAQSYPRTSGHRELLGSDEAEDSDNNDSYSDEEYGLMGRGMQNKRSSNLGAILLRSARDVLKYSAYLHLHLGAY